jgi:hypothetical protein
LPGLLGRLDAARGAGHQGNAGFRHRLAGACLRSHGLHGGGGWADELHSRIGAGLRELRVLGEESVTGMNGVGAGVLGHIENLTNVEIGFGGRGGANGIGFLGFAHVERGAVHVRVNHNRGDPHLVAGAQYTHRDLASVGYENFLEHLLRRRTQDSTGDFAVAEYCVPPGGDAFECRRSPFPLGVVFPSVALFQAKRKIFEVPEMRSGWRRQRVQVVGVQTARLQTTSSMGPASFTRAERGKNSPQTERSSRGLISSSGRGG